MCASLLRKSVVNWPSAAAYQLAVLRVYSVTWLSPYHCLNCYFAVLAWNCLFTPILESFGDIFPSNMVIHHFKNLKDHPCAEARRLSH